MGKVSIPYPIIPTKTNHCRHQIQYSKPPFEENNENETILRIPFGVSMIFDKPVVVILSQSKVISCLCRSQIVPAHALSFHMSWN